MTTGACRQIAAAVSINFDGLTNAGPDEMKQIGGQAREALIAAPIPPEIAEAVVTAYTKLGANGSRRGTFFGYR